MEAIQHQLLRLLHLPLNLHRIHNPTIVQNQDSSRNPNSNKMRVQQTEGQAMQTPRRSGNMINSTRYFPKIIHLAHLRLLLQQTPMAPHKARDLSIMEATIIITSKITSQMVDNISNSKILMISPNRKRIVVSILIRAFPRQVTQAVTTTEALLLIITAIII